MKTNNEFPVTVERSKKRRKTFSIVVNREKGVVVKVPHHARDEEIECILNKHKAWIQRKIEHIKNMPPPKPKRQFLPGETVLFFGSDYTIKVTQSKMITHPHCNLEPPAIMVYLPSSLELTSEVIEAALKKYYLMEADRFLRFRTQKYAEKLGLYPKKVIVKTQKTRWGSCDSKGVIRYNWQILCAETEVIDYLVVHELCHLKYNHHQATFWKLVETQIPDYQYMRRALRDYRDCW